MLDFYKYNNVLLQNKFQENIANNCDSIIGNLQQSYHCCTSVTYIQDVMSSSPILFGAMFYSTKTGKYLPIFMLSIMRLYFS